MADELAAVEDERYRAIRDELELRKREAERQDLINAILGEQSKALDDLQRAEEDRLKGLKDAAHQARELANSSRDMARAIGEVAGIGRSIATMSPFGALSGIGGLMQQVGQREAGRRAIEAQQAAIPGPMGEASGRLAAARQAGGGSQMAMAAGAAAAPILAMAEAAKIAAESILSLGKIASPAFASAWDETMQLLMTAIGACSSPG
jgi:hypothetical protein